MYTKELTEKKNDLVTRAEAILDKAKAEKRELTDDEAQELAEIRDDVRRIKETLKAKGFFDGEGMKPEDGAADGGERAKCGTGDTEKREKEERAANDRKAFEAYIRGTINTRENNMEKGDNGAVIPTTIAREIIKKVYDICPILDKSQKFNVKGKLDVPYYDEDTTAITVAYAEEFVDLESNVGQFTSVSLTGFLAGTLALISRSLINNAQFDIVGFVVDDMAYHISRFIEGELLNGTPDYVGGLSTLPATRKMTAAAPTAVTADEIIQLKDNIKDVFQNNAIWIMSSKTRTALRLLKDDVGRYLLQDDITSPFGSTLLGKPIYVSDNMPDMAADTTAIFYGDMSGLATKFNENMNIEVLREKYSTMHAIGVVGWFEFDSRVISAQKITALKMAASA